MSNPIKPSHYNAGEFDVIAFCNRHQLGFCEGNIIKYVTRWREKHTTNQVEDLKKAKEYLERLIEHHEHSKISKDNA